ncbi:MAG TPA: two-component regulator propeller domain-containing protein [Pyrinomonadaceae bacterium]|nr:two-component regulator propeller domain-containing protein [Pyrinomonadaceae bacterium]
MQSNCPNTTRRHGRARLLFFLLGAAILCLTSPAHGRAAVKPVSAPMPRLPGFHAQTWTTEQGLPGDTVRAVQQTRDGYLWIATQGGLARFDGVRFHVFNQQSVREFRTNECSELLEDASGQLWIGTIGGGLMRYAAGKFTAYGRAEGLPTDVVIRLFEDRAGRLWITSYESLTLFDGGKFTTFNTADGGRNVYSFPFHEDEAGRVWFFNSRGLSFTNSSTLGFYKDGRLHTGDEPAQLFPAKFAPNAGGLPVRDAFWVQSPETRMLTRLPFARGGTRAEVKYGADIVTPARAYEDALGRLWIATSRQELFLLSDGELRRVASNAPPRGAINALHADREGNLWVGTNDGLTRLKAQAFAAYTTADGLAHETPWTVFEDSRGELWIGTTEGVNRWRDGKFDTYTARDGMAGSAVVSIAEDASGRMWFGSTDGLTSYGDGQFQAYARREGLLNENVRGVLVDRRGRLWVGTVGGLHLFEAGRFKPYTTAEGLAHNNVLFMHEDAQGALWVGTPNGLNRLRDERFEVFTTKDGLASNIVIGAHETTDGVLWFGTLGGGLARFKDGRFKSLTSAAGLGDDTITRVLEDGAGNLWMGSTRGVLRASLKELNDYADERARSVTCIAYGKADGLPSIDCSGGTQPAGWRTRAGMLWFPTAQGIAVVDPSRLVRNELPPPVVVERLVVDHAAVALADGLRLPRGSRAVEFHFTALSFVDPSKVRFRYMLEGFDRDWVEAGARRDAFYTNLPPGSYRFRVLAANDDGVWSERDATLAFTLPPYFYQTRWFYLAAAILTAAAMWGIYQLRVRQLKHEFVAVLEERNRIARELHDSLAQGFTSISIHLEAVSAKMGAPHDAAREHLNQARLLVRSSLAEARRTVRDLRSELLEAGDLSAALSRVAGQLTAGTNVSAEVTVAGASRPLPARIESNLLRVGQEALTNAVRHAGARTVRARLEYGRGRVRLCVEDDGHGFDVGTMDAASNGGGFGLRGMRERLTQIGGTLSVESLPGRGTQITATVPLGENGNGE